MTAKELINCALVTLGEQVRSGDMDEANKYLYQALTALDTEKNGYVDSDKYSALVDDYAARGIEIKQLQAENKELLKT